MLLCLKDLGFEFPSFLRKINNKSHWEPEEGDQDLDIRAQTVAEKIFDEQKGIYSLWHISTEEEFFGVVASLTTNANPKNRNIYFIWITESELKEVGIIFKKIPEGDCFRVKDLHFDVEINSNSAYALCYKLMSNQRGAQRCPKNQTKSILEHQRQIGCKAADISSQSCQCE
jgi:hypothetical protein